MAHDLGLESEWSGPQCPIDLPDSDDFLSDRIFGF